MGYYTRYEVKADENLEEIIDSLVEVSNYGEYVFRGEDTVKWYNWEKDCLQVSKKFPDTLFSLSGAGEEHDHLWICYFLDGKFQYYEAEIVFPEFDISKLK